MPPLCGPSGQGAYKGFMLLTVSLLVTVVWSLPPTDGVASGATEDAASAEKDPQVPDNGTFIQADVGELFADRVSLTACADGTPISGDTELYIGGDGRLTCGEPRTPDNGTFIQRNPDNGTFIQADVGELFANRVSLTACADGTTISGDTELYLGGDGRLTCGEPRNPDNGSFVQVDVGELFANRVSLTACADGTPISGDTELYLDSTGSLTCGNPRNLFLLADGTTTLQADFNLGGFSLINGTISGIEEDPQVQDVTPGLVATGTGNGLSANGPPSDELFLIDGSRAMTGDLLMGHNRIAQVGSLHVEGNIRVNGSLVVVDVHVVNKTADNIKVARLLLSTSGTGIAGPPTFIIDMCPDGTPITEDIEIYLDSTGLLSCGKPRNPDNGTFIQADVGELFADRVSLTACPDGTPISGDTELYLGGDGRLTCGEPRDPFSGSFNQLDVGEISADSGIFNQVDAGELFADQLDVGELFADSGIFIQVDVGELFADRVILTACPDGTPISGDTELYLGDDGRLTCGGARDNQNKSFNLVEASTLVAPRLDGTGGALQVGAAGATGIDLGSTDTPTTVLSTAASTTTSTGGLVVNGGIGVAGGLNTGEPCVPLTIFGTSNGVGSTGTNWYIVPHGISAGYPMSYSVEFPSTIRRFGLVFDNEFNDGFTAGDFTVTVYVDGAIALQKTVAAVDAMWTGRGIIADPLFSLEYSRVVFDDSTSMDTGSLPYAVANGTEVLIAFTLDPTARALISGSEIGSQLDLLVPLSTT